MFENIGVLPEYLINGVLVGLLYGMVAMCFVLIYKSTQVVNFAQGEFLILGGWIGWAMVAQVGLPFWLAFLVTLGFTFVIGVLIQVVVMRPLLGEPLISVIMVTIGLSLFFNSLLKWMFGTAAQSMPNVSQWVSDTLQGGIVGRFDWAGAGARSREEGILTIQDLCDNLKVRSLARRLEENVPADTLADLQLVCRGNVEILGTNQNASLALGAVLAIGITILFYTFFRMSRHGLAMRATAFDQQVAASLGVSVRSVFALAWGISALVSAVAGIQFALINSMSGELAANGIAVFPAAIVGGLDSIAGGIVGGVIIGVVQRLSAWIELGLGGGMNLVEVAPFWVLLIVMMIKPYGLFGTKDIERV